MQNIKLLAGSFLIAALFLFPVVSPAQTVSIVSGNGQITCIGCEEPPTSFAPLVVAVNGSNGQPAVNTTVTWTVTQSGYNATSETATGSNGQATFDFVPPPLLEGESIVANITATALGATANFVETSFGPFAYSQDIPLSLYYYSPPTLSGQVGTTNSTQTLTFTVYYLATQLGFVTPLPNAQIQLATVGGSKATVSCATQPGQQPGTVLTNAFGVATCTPVYGNTIGTGAYGIQIGDYATLGNADLTVTAGPPALIKITGGNNQNVNPGVLAPLALQAEVTDLGGNPSTGATVSWAVTEGSATLSKIVTSSNSGGQVTADVTPTVGPVQVTVSLAGNAKVSAVFTVNVNIVATGMTIVSGNSQQAIVNKAFADPLIVQVNDNTIPVAGATVGFAVTGGTATLSAASATTNAQGQAQVTATAGGTPGTVTIVASVKSGSNTYSQTFSLTVNPAGPIISSINNAASNASQFVSPCSLAIIYGTGLTPELQGIAEAFIAPQTQVSGVTVQFGGVAAPILYVANLNNQESVAVEVPCETPAPNGPGTTTSQMVVSVNGVASTPFNVNVSQYSPGIFMTTAASGSQLPVLVREDGSFVSLSNPAQPNDTIRMFVTGLGQTSPPLFTDEFDPLVLEDGNTVPQPLPVNARVLVGINNGGVGVTWAGYAYGMVGVYEVDFVVPQSTPAGNNIPFVIAVYQGNNLIFSNGTVIPIAP